MDSSLGDLQSNIGVFMQIMYDSSTQIRYASPQEDERNFKEFLAHVAVHLPSKQATPLLQRWLAWADIRPNVREVALVASSKTSTLVAFIWSFSSRACMTVTADRAAIHELRCSFWIGSWRSEYAFSGATYFDGERFFDIFRRNYAFLFAKELL